MRFQNIIICNPYAVKQKMRHTKINYVSALSGVDNKLPSSILVIMDKAEFVKDTRMQVKFLKGVGEARSRQLSKLGIKTIGDLMEYFPRAYIARKLNPSLLGLKPGDNIALTAMISWVDERSTKKGKSMLNIGISDGRSTVVCTWFSYPKAYLDMLKPGLTLWVAGTLSEYNDQLQLMHPEFEWSMTRRSMIFGSSGNISRFTALAATSPRNSSAA